MTTRDDWSKSCIDSNRSNVCNQAVSNCLRFNIESFDTFS